MELLVRNKAKEVYLSGTQDLRDLIDILITINNSDDDNEFIVIASNSIPGVNDDVNEWTIDLNKDEKNINFA